MEVFYEDGRTYDDDRIGDDIGWLHAAGVEINYGLSILRFLESPPVSAWPMPPSETIAIQMTMKLWPVSPSSCGRIFNGVTTLRPKA